MTPRFSDNSYIWKCDQCSASFTSEYYLRRHEKKPHGKISHKCGTCHAVFIDLKDYAYHRFTWHKSQKSQDQNPPAPVQIDNTVHTQVVHPTNPTTSDQPQNQDIDWIMKFMESAGHPISPVGNTKMLEKMKADLVFFQSYPMISAALKTTYDTLNEFEKCEVFPPWAEFMASITKMLEMIQAMPPIHPQQHDN